MDFLYKKRELIKNFFIDLSEINYWENVSKKFKYFNDKQINNFSLSFKHDIKCDFSKDDELKIQAYANKYGYEIIKEEINAITSVYYFERKDNK